MARPSSDTALSLVLASHFIAPFRPLRPCPRPGLLPQPLPEVLLSFLELHFTPLSPSSPGQSPFLTFASTSLPGIAILLGSDLFPSRPGDFEGLPITALASSPRTFELLCHPIGKQKRSTWEESGTHMIGVDTFIDLPEKAFTKNSIQNHIFPSDAIVWACRVERTDSP